MIHTLELRRNCSDYAVFMKLQNNPALKTKYPGIEFITHHIGSEAGKQQYKVNVKINLSRTIDPGNYLRIYQGQKPEEIIETINQVFTELELPTVQAWTLYQVHFTVDIHTPYVSEYLDILSHGNHKAKPVYTRDGSLWIPYSSRTVTVNFYSKEAEQRKHGEEAATKARNILRLEVECKDKKLEYLFSKRQLHRDLVSMLLADSGGYIFDMVNATVQKELLTIIDNDCDHIRKDAAIAKVEASRGRRQQRTHQNLLHLIDLVNRKNGSIRTARENWARTTRGSTAAFKARLAELYHIGVNPICLPSDSPQERLESLYQLYLNALTTEYKTAMENRQNLQ